MKNEELQSISTREVEDRVIELRDTQIILDRDVADLYGVETKRINQAVRNNIEKFPEGYSFMLQSAEKEYVVKNFDRLTKALRPLNRAVYVLFLSFVQTDIKTVYPLSTH